LLDWTEAVIPSLTPDNLLDPSPAMRPVSDEMVAAGALGGSTR